MGTLLGLHLVAAGHRVWGLRRDPRSLPPEIIPLAGDLTDGASLRRALPEHLDAVAYTAAADGFSDAAYRAAYVTGPATLLQALGERRIAPQRLVFTSSTGVYGQSSGEWVDESSPAAAKSFSGLRLLEGEAIFRRSNIPTIALRLGGIYGPGRTRLLDRVLSGQASYDPARPVFSNRIHRQDAARALAHLLDLPNPEAVYLGVDDEPCDLGTLYSWIARRAGVAAPRSGGENAGNRQRSNKRCRNGLLRATGFALDFPTFREGYAPLIAERLAGC